MITIKVEQIHIDKGIKYNAYACPVALAVKEQLNILSVHAGYEYIRTGIWDTYKTPKKVLNFMNKFDGGKPVKPISFRLMRIDS